MSNPDIELRNLMRRVDRYAARLNPGLGAIVLVHATILMAEATTRLPVLYEMLSEANLVSPVPQMTSDPRALLPLDGPPYF